jgi:hypothetical protein
MGIDPTDEANAVQKELAWKFVSLRFRILIIKQAQTY